MRLEETTDVAVVGAGIVGVATAYALARRHGFRRVALVDPGDPFGLTSAQSGENYRNWWPHPVMVRLMDRSIDAMEAVARETGDRIALTRRGYVLATRETDVDALLTPLAAGLGADADRLLRMHETPGSAYMPARSADWSTAPAGVDVLRDKALIHNIFPGFDADVSTVIHLRRAGDVSGQQLGQAMLERVREAGGRLIRAAVTDIAVGDGVTLSLKGDAGPSRLRADALVNAAGPFAGQIAEMLGVSLPLHCVAQQKIAFPDTQGALPRDLPFAIDLDPLTLDWTEDERAALAEDLSTKWLTEAMPGAIHRRPDGGASGAWIKLGWAYNTAPAPATWETPLDDAFPEIALRGAARLTPALKGYYGRLPAARRHYGGWYTMTAENWPLIGPMGPPGVFMNCAHSGFGTMAACAAGALCAAHVAGVATGDDARLLSLARYDDPAAMEEIRAAGAGVL